VALDVFTCGEKVIPEAAFEVFRELFRPKLHNLIEIKRGIRV
jgi:S-adenosylmethionine/arginine decarboxylase-like enzyme